MFERSLAQFGDLITDTSFVLDDSWGQVRKHSCPLKFSKDIYFGILANPPMCWNQVYTVPNVPHGKFVASTLHQAANPVYQAALQSEKPGMFYYALSVLVLVLEKGSDAEPVPPRRRRSQFNAQVPGKSMVGLKRRFNLLQEDIKNIERGRVPLPHSGSDAGVGGVTGLGGPGPSARNGSDGGSDEGCNTPSSSGGTAGSGGAKKSGAAKAMAAKTSDQERRKGIPWTEEEHRLFLLGRGDWRSISRNFVISRTPTQVGPYTTLHPRPRPWPGNSFPFQLNLSVCS